MRIRNLQRPLSVLTADAFTLVEMRVVVAVMGVLAAGALGYALWRRRSTRMASLS